MQSNFIIAGQKISFCILFAIFNKNFLSFCATVVAISLSTKSLTTSIIREELRISSA